ncbi:uncharacterized protein TrAtP1_008263 [Trichoderma atroviride]|nr:hypothetical protein TrAtP1_008263 [Trichoderma atroviride]
MLSYEPFSILTRPYFWQQKSLPSRESEPYSHGLWWLLTPGTPARDAAKFQAYPSVERLRPPYRWGYLDNVPICEPLIGRSSTSIDANQHRSHAGSTTLWALLSRR